MRSRPVPLLAALLVGALLPGALPRPATANPYLEVASALDEGDPFDLHVSVDYLFSFKTAAIMREAAGSPGTAASDPMPLDRDLTYQRTRHTLFPRAELGVFTDLSISVALPIILHDRRELAFANGVSAATSSTIRDGLLPERGFDARNPGGPGFDPAGSTIFRGPDRAGIDQIHIGTTWAPMNQERDPTKPTWKIGGEVRLAIGRPADFDPVDPDRETGVGRGVHEVLLFTSMARRMSWAIPYVEVWWLAPFATRDGAPLEPPARLFGATRTSPVQRAATRFGFEAIAWESLADRQRIGIDIHTMMQANFEGRDYSEMWEVFRYAGHVPSGGPLILDADPVTPGVQAMSHPGVTNIENYLTVRASAGLTGEIGDTFRFGAHFATQWEQSHLITFAEAGVDRDGSGLVEPGTDEVNPLHAPLVDSPGRRYRVGSVRDYMFFLHARALF